MESIDERLSQVETNLLQAAAKGGHALTAFHNNLAVLLADMDHEARTTNVDDKTMASRGATSWRVLLINEHLLDLQTMADTSSLYGDMEAMFSRIDIKEDSMADISIAAIPTHSLENLPSQSSTVYPHDKNSTIVNPPYIEPAYSWLLKNLHNPYPSKAKRESIARETGTNQKNIDAWFIDARKRIGWNTLRREQFSNKRIDIVDAATRFFLQPEETSQSINTKSDIQFAEIEKRARDLYSDRFSASALAVKLDAAVKDLTPEMKAQAREVEIRRKQQEKEVESRLEHDSLAALSYPSPEHSPGYSPEPIPPSPPLEGDDLATTYIEAIAGQKRSNSSSSPDEEDAFTSANRPRKRSRLDVLPTTVTVLTGLPSPVPSPIPSHESLQVVDNHSTPSSPRPHPISHSSRKRRLSEADNQGVPKRPHTLHAGPRMQAVSDPLPISSVLFEASRLDDWFHTNFGISHSDELDASLPLDLEVFDYSALDLNKTRLETPTSTTEDYPALDPNGPIPALVADEVPFPEGALDISTNDFNYDELFWDLEETVPEFCGQDVTKQPQDISLLMSEPPLTDPAQNFNTLDTEFFPQLSNMDWLFPPAILPPNIMTPVEKHPNFSQSVLSQDPSALFNPSMISANSTDPSFENLLLQADKAAKQKKLQEMKEATRKLEEELAAS